MIKASRFVLISFLICIPAAKKVIQLQQLHSIFQTVGSSTWESVTPASLVNSSKQKVWNRVPSKA
jgi:hypothetical protein